MRRMQKKEFAEGKQEREGSEGRKISSNFVIRRNREEKEQETEEQRVGGRDRKPRTIGRKRQVQARRAQASFKKLQNI